MNFHLIIERGRQYATENWHFFTPDGIQSMSRQEFAQAALDNYNRNASAFGEDLLPEFFNEAFLRGANLAYVDIMDNEFNIEIVEEA